MAIEMLHVLLIEDSPGDARLAQEILAETHDQGYEIDLVSTLAAATTRLAQGAVDVALLDLGLPDSQGMSTLEGLQAAAPSLPIVVLSGLDDASTAVEAVRRGAEDYLVKGRFDDDLLSRTLRYAVERKRLSEQLREEAGVVEMLQRIGSSLIAELDLERVAHIVTDEATQRTNAAFGAFFYKTMEAQGAAYRLCALSGASLEAFSHLPLPGSTPLLRKTLEGRGVVRLDDVSRDPQFGASAPFYGMPPGHLPVRSYLAVPVTSRTGDVVGGLFFGHPEPNCFTERDERIAAGIAGWAAVAMDNARLYEARQRAVEARDRMLAVVSHDLRSPVQVIRCAVELLCDQVRDATSVSCLDKITRATVHMARMLDDLLDIARIEAGTLSTAQTPCDAREIVQEACEARRSAAMERNVTLICEMPADLPPIYADHDRILQVLSNLVGNAIKFTPAQGQIRLSAAVEKDEVRFAVTDTGPGIPVEEVPRLFERFYKGSTAVREGAGLGLAIAKSIVEAHGGRLWVESATGAGSTFFFTVPVAVLPR